MLESSVYNFGVGQKLWQLGPRGLSMLSVEASASMKDLCEYSSKTTLYGQSIESTLLAKLRTVS